MQQDHGPIVSLFENTANISGIRSDYYYKLITSNTYELNVLSNVFGEFIESILCYVHVCLDRYYKDKIENEDYFDPLVYTPVLLEKMDKLTSPVIVDVNFQFEDEGAYNFYHDKFIYESVKFLQETLLTIFNVPNSEDDINKMLVCFVLETDPWTENDKQCISLRFHFPYARSKLEYLNRIIIPKYNNFLFDDHIVKDYVFKTPSNTNKLVEEKSEYISVYGCKEKENKPPYLFKSAYTFIEDVTNLETDYEDESVLPFYFNYNITHDDVTFINNYFKNPIELREDVEILKLQQKFSAECNSLINCGILSDDVVGNDRLYNLPLILSLHFSNETLNIDKDLINDVIEPAKKETKDEGTAFNVSADRFEILQYLMPMIGKHRFTEKNKYDWITIGKTIHSIYRGSANGLAIFKKFTEDPVLKDKCEEEYNDFPDSIYDIRTIRQYASMDNPNEYAKLHAGIYKQYIVNAIQNEEIAFAQFAAEILCLDFTYDRNNNEWFYFDGTRLIKDNKGTMLRSFIANIEAISTNGMYNGKHSKIHNAINEFRKDIAVKISETNDKFTKEYYSNMDKSVAKLMRRLTMGSFLKKVAEALELFLYDDNLYKKTDENPLIMACKDCVIECFEGKIITRPGRMQDYITKSTGICFPHTYTIDSPKVKFVLKYYGQVHTDNELCHYFLKTLASLLRGGNAEKFFINWIGEANASKSQVVKFLQASLGEYAVIIPNHLLTLNQNSNVGKPEPALERAKGARVCIAAETDRSEKWHVGHIKKFTSGDDYDNRTLNKEGGTRSASFQLIAMSNIDLDAPNADEAYHARYVKIPFLSKYVDDAPADVEEQYKQRRFPIDLEFSQKITKYAQANLWVMVYYYSIYIAEGIRVLPEIVKTVTMKHQRDIDVMFNFIQDRLQIFYVGDPKDKIKDNTKKSTIYDLHSLYKSWYRSAYGSDVLPLDQFKFRDEMSRRIGEPDEYNCWIGVTAKQLDMGSRL